MTERKYPYFMNNRVCALIDDAIDAAGGIVDLTPDLHFVSPYRPGSNKRRRYLGGSTVGNKCVRAGWYGFRWAADPVFEPRVLRLFDRGHREEDRFINWLRMIGAEVDPFDPATMPQLWYHAEGDGYAVSIGADEPGPGDPLLELVTGTFHEWRARSMGVEIPEPRQFSWEAFDGHHRGNSDGRARNLPDQTAWGLRPDEWVLAEYKTHNTASFTKVTLNGVFKGKHEHWCQMQRYMEKLNLRLALYGAVCKDTDALYFEYVPYDPTAAVKFDASVRESIYAIKPPVRLSNSPSWFECKFCDHRSICHFGAPLNKNCRTCVAAQPVEDGRWRCNRWNAAIPKDVEHDGCDAWVQIND